MLVTILVLKRPQGVDTPQLTAPARTWKSSPHWVQLLPVQVNREQVLGHQVSVHHVVKHGDRVLRGEGGVGQPQDPIELGVGEDITRFLGAQAHSLLVVHNVGDLQERQSDLHQGALQAEDPERSRVRLCQPALPLLDSVAM